MILCGIKIPVDQERLRPLNIFDLFTLRSSFP